MPKNQPELKLISLEDVVVEPVRWLWYPYIPLGKLTILHGDPGEGKTTLALWIAAACSRGQALPDRENGEPLTVLYQTAEDGLGDTIKPRLLESKADLHHIYTIDETDFPLSMLDHRIGEAIEKTHAQLMILDPMQAYLGEKVDMNRANEVRNVMKGLTKVASQTGCAIVLVGHLNKSQTANSANGYWAPWTSEQRPGASCWWEDLRMTGTSGSWYTTNPPWPQRETPGPSPWRTALSAGRMGMRTSLRTSC